MMHDELNPDPSARRRDRVTKRLLNSWYRLAPLWAALICTLLHHFWLTPPAAQIRRRSVYGTKLDGGQLKDVWRNRDDAPGVKPTNPLYGMRITNKQ